MYVYIRAYKDRENRKLFQTNVHNSWFLKALTIYDIQSIHSGNKNNNSDKPLKASNDHEIQAHDECM